jgi:hypothetical protein
MKATACDKTNRFLKSICVTGILVIASFLMPVTGFAQPVNNVEANFAGNAADVPNNWGGQKGAVTDIPDDTCANMGATNKVNLVSNFGFTLPQGATVTGVEAFIKAGAADPDGQPVGVQLASNADVSPPVLLGSQRQIQVPGIGKGNCASTIFSSVNGTLGGWGLSPGDLTPAIVNNATFGMEFVKITTKEVKVDAICLEIFYETDTGPAVLEACDGPPPTTTTTTNTTAAPTTTTTTTTAAPTTTTTTTTAAPTTTMPPTPIPPPAEVSTLNKYGLAILALLMLGIGFVGYRRLI